jgi:ribosomal protein S27E
MDEPKTKPMGVRALTDTGAKFAVVKCGKCAALVRILGDAAKVTCPKCGGDVPSPGPPDA